MDTCSSPSLPCKLSQGVCLLDVDTGLASGGCDFLASMQQLQMLSLARTGLVHASLAAIVGGLTTLTTLSLAW